MGRSLCRIKTQQKWVVPFTNLKRNSSTPPLECSQSKAIPPMKEKFCKGNIFIPHFLTGPDRRYKMGHCGILPKNCHVVPSPLDTQTTPCDTWHSSLHLDVSHPEFYLANVLPYPDVSQTQFYPANVLPYPDVSQPQFYLADVPLSPDGRGGRFNFPGQTHPDPLVTLTRTSWLVRHSRFAGSISAHNKKDNSDNTDDQVS